MDGGKKGWEMSGGKTVLEFRLAPQTWLISSLANLQIPNERTTIDEPGGARSKGVRGGLVGLYPFSLLFWNFNFQFPFSLSRVGPVKGITLTRKISFHFVNPTFDKWIYTFVCFPVWFLSFSSHRLGFRRPVWWVGWRWSGGVFSTLLPRFVCLPCTVSNISLVLLLWIYIPLTSLVLSKNNLVSHFRLIIDRIYIPASRAHNLSPSSPPPGPLPFHPLRHRHHHHFLQSVSLVCFVRHDIPPIHFLPSVQWFLLNRRNDCLRAVDLLIVRSVGRGLLRFDVARGVLARWLSRAAGASKDIPAEERAEREYRDAYEQLGPLGGGFDRVREPGQVRHGCAHGVGWCFCLGAGFRRWVCGFGA